MDQFVKRQLSKRPLLTLFVIAVLSVTVASATGLMAPVTKVIGRAVGGIKFSVLRLFGVERRQAA